MPSLHLPQKPITVSIVSHGHLELILPLLDQLDAFSCAVVEKVILTLNIPESDLLVGRSWRFPLERIENASAKGFGANHNQAFRRCSSEWFLVLNPDIRFAKDVLTPLLAQAKAKSGLLSPRILEPGKSKPEQHRRIITPLEILTRRRPSYLPPTAPAWVPGLFMLFRSKTYAQIDGFDEKRFFMYGEDFDICARAQLEGWQLQVGSDLNAVHDARRASHRNFRHMWWHLQSLLKVWSSSPFWRLRKLMQSRSTADA